jgi:hypothetical protein
MRRVAALLIGLLTACDPIRVISVPVPSSAKPSNACTLSVFQSSPDLRAAGLTRDGDVYATLIVPVGLSSPEPRPDVSIYASRPSSGASGYALELRWVCAAGTSGYTDYANGVLSRLAESLAAHCAD